MAEYKSKLQSNVNWTETFKMGRKAPAIANRIFLTLADAQLYADDITDSATEGIRITVLRNWNYVPDVNGKKYGEEGYIETIEDGDYSGLYYIKQIGDGVEPGILVKLGRGNAAWYKGNAVSEDGSSYELPGAMPGDLYLNTETLDIYVLQNTGTWARIGNMGAKKVDASAEYYILSANGKSHPVFDIENWIRGDEDGSNIPTDYETFAQEHKVGQVYMWTRIVDSNNKEAGAKYTVSLVYSSLDLGSFDYTEIIK